MAAAQNARLTQVVEYAPDPRGWRTFTSLSAVLHRGLQGHNTAPVIERGAQWSGWAQNPQPPLAAGLANLGRSRPMSARHSTLADEKSTATDDPSLRIFAERLARR